MDYGLLRHTPDFVVDPSQASPGPDSALQPSEVALITPATQNKKGRKGGTDAEAPSPITWQFWRAP